MTELLYQKDSYLQEFQAIVSAIDPESHAICLDQTAFYPGGGGQPNDTGWITLDNQSIDVIQVKKIGDHVWHTLHADANLPQPGTMLNAKINWGRRYQLMRTHSAMHVLCGVVFRDYCALVTGGNMDPLEGRMDFEFETLSKDLVHVIEESVNKEIQKDHPIRVQILPRDEAFQIPDLIRTKINLLPEGINEIRTIEIVELDLQADGGTHVHSTSEIGKAHIVDYKSKGKINKRIYLKLDE
ncbi:MAG: alanyl-tRNA editing protein [Anaerolineaceae bacterium]|nr:alanyl-tRNA editing protein [Anaerolineaceae bacterium]